MVGKDSQSRQRLLKAKIVKFDHDRHYIKEPYRAHRGITITITNTVIATSRRESQQISKHGERKGREKKERKN